MSLAMAIILVMDLYPRMVCDRTRESMYCEPHEVCERVKTDERIEKACEVVLGEQQ